MPDTADNKKAQASTSNDQPQAEQQELDQEQDQESQEQLEAQESSNTEQDEATAPDEDKQVQESGENTTSKETDSAELKKPKNEPKTEKATDLDDLDPEELEAPDVQEVQVDNPNLVKISDHDNEKAHWYVVHTYSGRENKVAETLKQRAQTLNLDNKIIKVLIPTKEKIQIRKGKRKTVNEKIFPGYMLVNMEMSDDAWLAVRTTNGVTGFVGTSSKPSPLPRHEVDAIRQYMTQATPQYKAEFTEGQAVRITDGPFDDFLGTVKAIDEDKGQVEVLINIFGRETPVELDFLQVEKV
jgi:transcriptional antiterminator NusG